MNHRKKSSNHPARLNARRSVDFLPVIVDLLSIWDVAVGVITGKVVLILYYRSSIGHDVSLEAAGSFWREIILSSLLAGMVLREPRLATDRALFSPGRLFSVMRVRGTAVLALLLMVGLATRAIDDRARAWLLGWSTLFGFCVALSRIAFLLYVRRLIGIGVLREAIAIVTFAGSGGHLATRLAAEADVVLSVGAGDELAAGMFTDAGAVDAEAHRGSIDEILALGRCGGIDAVVLELSRGHNSYVPTIVDRLRSLPVQVILCPDASWNGAASEGLRLLGGLPMVVVANRPIRAWNLLAKLLLDKLVSASVLVLALPLMLVIAAAIAVESPGPVIFRQRRSGWGGRSFVLFKFRTMYAGSREAVRQTMRQDPRCTRLGAFLRRTSLDELPQLINVLLGDMSLVGPRPHVDTLHADEMVSQALVAEYAQRYRVKPGMTGWAQVNGFRGATTTAEQLRRRVEHDLFYIENWSLLFDIRILLLTPFTVLSGENAF